MEADALAVDRLDVGAIRKLIRTMDGSDSEVRHIYGALSRFCDWMVEDEQGWMEANPCDALPRRQRPKPGKSRDHVLRSLICTAVWAAVEDEPTRDLIRFLLLVPLRRDEAAGLCWSEVDLDRKRILIAGDRMKNGEAHELPLAKPALAILTARKPQARRQARRPCIPVRRGQALRRLEQIAHPHSQDARARRGGA